MYAPHLEVDNQYRTVQLSVPMGSQMKPFDLHSFLSEATVRLYIYMKEPPIQPAVASAPG